MASWGSESAMIDFYENNEISGLSTQAADDDYDDANDLVDQYISVLTLDGNDGNTETYYRGLSSERTVI